MVTLIYRCETDEREVNLNHEHDDYEWVAPQTAAERLGATLGDRFERAVERAAGLDGAEPFETVADPYADSETSRDEVLAELAAARAADGPGDLDLE